jgi:cell division protein FtsI (penicillin-binding protein 3)
MRNKNTNIRKVKYLSYLSLLIFLTLLIFIYSLSKTILKDRKMPKLLSSQKDLAIRGNIYSADNFKIATSKKLFKASIDMRCLDIDKQNLFIKLFSIYGDIKEEELLRKIIKFRKQKKTNVILSYKIDARSAKNLNELRFKLRRLEIFKSIKINGNKIIHGLKISESGEKRLYPYRDTFTPIIGYMNKFETKHGTTKINGIKGLENKYNKALNSSIDGILKGERDVLSYIIFTKNSIIKSRQDGENIYLNIPLKLQRNFELILDKYKIKFEANEIIISVMDSHNGKILALASSNRFNPSKIQKKDIKNLNINAIEYQFEPGSVVKPISLSLVLDKNKVTLNELIFAHNKSKKDKKGKYKRGKYKLGKWIIRDDHHFKKNYLTLKDIIINSSNIGTLILAQRLSGQEFFDGYNKFGLSHKTGIDLSYEQKGFIHKAWQYKSGENKNKDNAFKATDSYGQGITVTFMQLMKAYMVFNNDGKFTNPTIINSQNKILYTQVIKKETANIMKKLLIQAVQEGTGKKTIINGLEIGGKTGTANVVEGGRYQRRYMSSFFGFANDEKGNKYTIGVTVNNPNHYYYYASNSAVPLFKELVSTLVKLNYLEPKYK